MFREWRKRDELLPVVGIMYIDSAKSQGVLGQRKKMSYAATRKENMSRVSFRLWLWD